MRLKNVLVAAILVTGGVAGAGVATAADIDNCGHTQTCMWDDNDYQDKIAARSEGSDEIRNLDPNTQEDKMDSYANNSDVYQTCAWSNRNGTGDSQDWEENEHDANVSPLNSDEVSSWRTKFGC